MKISVGSLNPAKINAVKASSPEGSTLVSADVPSEVSDQPFSDEETLQGAINRAKKAREDQNATIGIGLEGGVMWMGDRLYLCNWGALVTDENKVYTAGGARIPLPQIVVDGLNEGLELGDVMDRYAKETGIRYQKGAIGLLTDGAVTRVDMFTQVTKLLFSQIKVGNHL